MTTRTVDATVVTNALLKRGTAAVVAQTAMQGSMVLAYAVKEVRHGPFMTYVYVHNVMVQERSMTGTRNRISGLFRAHYKQQTAMQALNDAESEVIGRDMPHFVSALRSAEGRLSGVPTGDQALASLITDGLERRIQAALKELTQLASNASHALSCFAVGASQRERDGRLSLGVAKCPQACGLGSGLAGCTADVATLVGVVGKHLQKQENVKRLSALEWVRDNPGSPPSTETCRALGDAVYALLCPPGGTIVTTNVTDHQPLASALGKHVQLP